LSNPLFQIFYRLNHAIFSDITLELVGEDVWFVNGIIQQYAQTRLHPFDDALCRPIRECLGAGCCKFTDPQTIFGNEYSASVLFEHT
jgi:hypothetical protein